MKFSRKRWISLITVLAILATLFVGVGVSAADETAATEGADISQVEEDFLLYLGILKTSGPVQTAETTRGGLAQIASRVAALPEYTGNEVYFSDVPTDHKYYKEINAMATAGILNGDGNGKFRPDDPVTANELCKVFAVILGYDVVGYYETYPVISNRIGLTDGIVITGNVTVGQMLAMVCNTLDLEMMEQITYGDEDEYKVQEGYTALERYHGLVKQRGIVSGTYGTRLTGSDGTIEKNHLIIGGKTFYWEDPSLLGKEVVFYSNRDKSTGGTKQEIEFLYVDPERNQSITIQDENVEGINGKNFEWYEGSRKKSVQLVDAPDVIINGIAYPEYTAADLKPTCGTVTLLNNNGDNLYDVIFVEEYTFMMIGSVDQEEGVIYGKYPNISVGSKTQDEAYLIMMEAGIVGELGFLIPGDMVAIQTSKNAKGTKRITVTYLGEGTTGVIEGIHDDIYTISGVEYRITDATAKDNSPYVIGQTVAVYTHEGQCAGLIHADNDTYKFGYLIDAALQGSVFSGKLAVRIVNQQREMLELEAVDKLMLDEMVYTKAEDAWRDIRKAADMRKYSTVLEKSIDLDTTTESAVVNELCRVKVLPKLREGETNFPYSQPVRYRLNNDGQLTHLDTMIKGVNETEESLMAYQQSDTLASGDDCYQSASEVMEGVMYSTQDRTFYTTTGSSLDSGVLYATMMSTGNIIMPPYAERDEVAWYGTGNLAESYYVAEAYTVNKYKMARYAVVYNRTYTTEVSADNNFYIIGDVERTLGEDGEVVRQITLYGSGGPYTRILADEIDDSQVAVGNVVQFQVDAENRVVAMKTQYAVADGEPGANARVWQTGTSSARPWGSRYRATYGTVLAYTDDLIVHTTSVGSEVWKNENLRNYRVDSAGFYRYTEEGGSPEVEIVNSGAVIPYDTDPKTTQKVIMITYNGRLDAVYIIDKD